MKPVSTESLLLQEALIGTHTHPGQTPVNPQQCQRPFVLLWGYSHLSNIPPTPRLQLQWAGTVRSAIALPGRKQVFSK